MKTLSALRKYLGARLLGIDPQYVGLWQGLDTVLHLPAHVVATLATEAAERRLAGAAPTGRLTGTDASVATDAPTLAPGIPGKEWHGLRCRHIDLPPMDEWGMDPTYTLAVLDDGTFTLRQERKR